MCFFGGNKTPAASAPAPAPAPPAPIAEEQDVKSPRRSEDMTNYGTTTPSLRVDRSSTSGGVGAGGSGLRV